jgi:hypothetical protein
MPRTRPTDERPRWAQVLTALDEAVVAAWDQAPYPPMMMMPRSP